MKKFQKRLMNQIIFEMSELKDSNASRGSMQKKIKRYTSYTQWN